MFSTRLTLAISILTAATSAPAAVLNVPSPYNTIQAAIDAAAIVGDTVVVDSVASPYMGPGNVNLSFRGKEVVVQSIEPLNPVVRNATVIDAADTTRIAAIDEGEGPGAKMRGLSLRRGGGPGQTGGAPFGGAVVCVGTAPVLENCRIGASNTQDGGAVASRGGAAPTLVDCLLTGNSATAEASGTGRGGAVHVSQSSSLTLRNCTLAGNSAELSGGAAYGDSASSLVISRSRILGNHADKDGGGIIGIDLTKLRVTRTEIKNNVADRFGGGVRVHSTPNTIITACDIFSNEAGNTGGGINFFNTPGTVRFSTVVNNEAEKGGGGIHLGLSDATILRCEVERNDVTSDLVANGGGIQCSGGNPVVIATRIAHNTAQSGGGIAALASSSPTLVSCIIDSNSVAFLDESAGAGGGILAENSSPTIQHCTIVENQAQFAGGALYVDGTLSVATINNSILYSNTGNEIDVAAGVALADYSDIEGGFPGTGNIDIVPVWQSPALPDYEYVPDVLSPTIDSADPTDPEDAINWCGLANLGIDFWCTPSDTNTCLPDMGAYGGQDGDWWMVGTPAFHLPPCGTAAAPEVGTESAARKEPLPAISFNNPN
ncbi:MAG: hypothetical protein CME06_00585 [Gemmatimonadetes bacterium]|nr:hypothetical protein [Gemmatimonadota bacterium]